MNTRSPSSATPRLLKKKKKLRRGKKTNEGARGYAIRFGCACQGLRRILCRDGFVLANEINAANVRNNPAFYDYWNGVSRLSRPLPGKLTLLANVDDSMETVQFGAAAMTAPNFFGESTHTAVTGPTRMASTTFLVLLRRLQSPIQGR